MPPPRSMEASLVEQIASGQGCLRPVALVVAHPDDETLGLGSRLAALDRLKLIHLTDGSPRCLDDAERAGFVDGASYAAARRRELDAALAALGVRAERIAYGERDQETIKALDRIVARLVGDLDGVDAVVTHPYEHGHPDHDTAALAVALACRVRAARGQRVPERIEFASYHLRQGRPLYGVFWPDPERPERRIDLNAAALAQKRGAIDRHASQRAVLEQIPLSPERLRVAPEHDFGAPAPPREGVYDGYGWEMTSERWRRIAAAAWRRSAQPPEDERWLAQARAAAR